jgi:hypothetical protein
MTGTHGRDRPVLADDGGVAVHARRPLRLERHKNKGVTLEPPPAIGEDKKQGLEQDDFGVALNASSTIFLK